MMLSVGLLFGTNAVAGIYDQLNAKQQSALQKGQQVVVVEDVQTSPWPRVTIFQRVEATPEETAAVFHDYELESQFVDSMENVKITSRPQKGTAIVDYSMSILFISICYTVESRVSTYDSGNSYQFNWKMLKGDKMDDIVGQLKIEALGTGSIMMYQNLIVPHTTGFRDKAISMTRDFGAALREQIQSERTGNQKLLNRQVQMLRGALAVKAEQGDFWDDWF